MNYSQEAFIELYEEVERQGGTHLDEVCQDRIFSLPDRKNGPPKPYRSVRCKASALFEIPYELEDPGPEQAVGLLKVCAVDDNMGRWPRFMDGIKSPVTV